MSHGKARNLDRILENLMRKSGGRFDSCVVTNERGLVVAWKGNNGVSHDALAAMMSLFSETSRRINTNLHIGDLRTASIKTIDATLSLHEFMVNDRAFRIAAILNEEQKKRFSFFRRGMTLTRMQENINTAAFQIKAALERR
ncbi:MAG: roadblock/LC7 domain-containing protein [Candidatus Thorarchaeota archaeon]